MIPKNKRRQKIIKGILMLILVFLISGCTVNETAIKGEYSLNDFILVLEASQDFQDYSRDFRSKAGRDFDPILVEEVKLDKEVIAERRKMMENNTAISAYVALYNGLPDKELYEVWIDDKEDSSRGIIAVFDMDEKKVFNFIAVIKLVQTLEYIPK